MRYTVGACICAPRGPRNHPPLLPFRFLSYPLIVSTRPFWYIYTHSHTYTCLINPLPTIIAHKKMQVERSDRRGRPETPRPVVDRRGEIAKIVRVTRIIPIDISPLYLSFIKFGSKTAAARASRLIKFPSPGFSRPAAAKRMPECKIERAEQLVLRFRAADARLVRLSRSDAALTSTKEESHYPII